MNEFREKNHYVPETYLNNWADTNKKIWVYSVLVPHQKVPLWKKSYTAGLVRLSHLYTRVAANELTDEVERWFDTEFESPAAKSMQKAISNERLLAKDWSNLIRFVAAQDVRTPARLLEILKQGQQLLPDLMDDVLKQCVQELSSLKIAGKPPDINMQNISEFLPIKIITELPPEEDFGKLRVESIVGRSYWLFAIKQLLTKTINVLLQHKWTILQSPTELKWLTSDDPVIKLNYYNPQKYDFGEGWGSLGTEIFLPLSPKYLLYTKIGSKPLRRGTVLPLTQATFIQKVIVLHAHRYVFSFSEDSSVNIIRPRKIDAEIFEDEAEQWRKWHSEQASAEKNLL